MKTTSTIFARKVLKRGAHPAELLTRLEEQLTQLIGIAGPLYLYGTDQPGVAVVLLPPSFQPGEHQWYVCGGYRMQVPKRSLRLVMEGEGWSCAVLEMEFATNLTPLSKPERMREHHNLRYLFVAGIMINTLCAAAETVITYSHERRAFGVPLNRHQLVQHALVSAFAECTANRLWYLDLADQVDRQLLHACESIQELRALAWSQAEVIDQIAPVHGARGTTAETRLSEYRVQLHRWVGLIERMENLSDASHPAGKKRIR
ncbi:MAG: hypothetical protein H0Z34_03635 [Brevibacillus sp.]|nr:hypothetical protein [Brevibacillus sp.]